MDKKEELIAYFKSEIKDSSAKEIVALKEEIQAIRNQTMNELDEQAAQAADVHFAQELSEMNSDHAIALSHLNDENNRRLMAERQRMVEEVFHDAKEALFSYTSGIEYIEKLTGKLRELKQMNLTPAILYVRKEDEAYLSDLIKSYELPCEGEVDANIHIGGFRIECLEKGVVVDETFDSALQQSKSWFYDTSGLVIR